MDLTRFKVLTFDIVGTCVDFERGVLDGIRRFGGPKAAGLDDDSIFAPYVEARDLYHGRTSEAFGDVYLQVAKVLDLDMSEMAAAGFQAAILNLPVFPDSVEALARLRRYYRLVAMTNADRVAYSAYAHSLGLPFDDAITCDEARCSKPDPRFFDYNRGRQSAFGFKQEDILHVAQSQHHDIGVAHSLGYKTCWIERRHDQNGFGGTPTPPVVTTPDLHLTSLAELADRVEAAFAK
ncbi:HAD-IA family hydrolase [Pseudodonghicola flavimaris]|uniref:HAD-IA family hydrolase n=1 Tax=Pseudodonghicola flavimaris TaxID=3050036 RepID=A0ABT7F276_9RHOB|nr:HAD-IA family hydrolase [Pseudodonghicola flavimaris]MDK3018554.1 HAD-IA family hydrolase [Pseudodonghicola flavimaris]